MLEPDVILAKVGNIQRCLRRISEVTDNDPDALNEIDKQDIFVLNLQRAIEATIDIATHVIASEGLGLATTIKENFKLLRDAGIIGDEVMKKMQSMVGFRNIAIHDYTSIDTDILKSILKNNLKDIEEFYTLILKRFNICKQN
ncbi:hypothetical protein JZK55_16750 [Dissulfurispira thermophila]|uniref:DUF86 domain-containing protein n=2 Tax=root TaxID=1 RepID=A0A7G1H3R2_9BACT|nr:DUF86 domain-containing protein [Dissulfurispira thermophila]BCB96753.1 hypothetical protein JZK55_16750 [Dissulfurispira thermophila]